MRVLKIKASDLIFNFRTHLGLSAGLAGLDGRLPVKLREILYYCADQTIRASLSVLGERGVILQHADKDRDADDILAKNMDTGMNNNA